MTAYKHSLQRTGRGNWKPKTAEYADFLLNGQILEIDFRDSKLW